MERRHGSNYTGAYCIPMLDFQKLNFFSHFWPQNELLVYIEPNLQISQNMTKSPILPALTNLIFSTSFFELHHSNFGGCITTIICSYKRFQTSICFTFGALSDLQNITCPEDPSTVIIDQTPHSNRVNIQPITDADNDIFLWSIPIKNRYRYFHQHRYTILILSYPIPILS